MPVCKPSDVNEIAARELELYIENDSELYRQRTLPIQENLRRKMAKGIYDATKAVKAFSYLVSDGAKKYTREFGRSGEMIFDKCTREHVARRFAEEFEVEERIQTSDDRKDKPWDYTRD